MNNLLRCETCKKILVKEEARKHTQCDPYLKKFKTLEASSYYMTENDNGESCLVINGLNEIGYTFVIKEPYLVPIELSCDVQHPKLNKENFNNKHPASEQILISTSVKLSRFSF